MFEKWPESPRAVNVTSPIPIIPKSSPSVASKQQGRSRTHRICESQQTQHLGQVSDDSYDYKFRIFPMDEDIEEDKARIASEARSFNFG